MTMEAVYQDDMKNLKATELTLGLPGTQSDDKHLPEDDNKPQSSSSSPLNNNNKRASPQMEKSDLSPPAPKAQVVGWPPVRNFRKNVLSQQSKPESDGSGMFVKVSMDGAPFLRKVDLKCYKNYSDLLKGLEGMFKCRFENCNGAENALTYEDKDGDWMLVGDVPWEMFVTSCKRLRIMKGSEAKGLGAQ